MEVVIALTFVRKRLWTGLAEKASRRTGSMRTLGGKADASRMAVVVFSRNHLEIRREREGEH